ncbi:hypothetical protein E2K93_12865 [Thalassotalea sp. HSM 43]|uniref:DUF6746 family protein n=1 Tax=Thalassotalea sp. HSM 43 TaxID=2552945 RepID=UPI001080138E|nr:DUF6746 family protein [Thalassotalea sp. HSM 43]QBY05216.1 hypothetical protein E2K93_12865 [Thalassotalea sp. HSM 43]
MKTLITMATGAVLFASLNTMAEEKYQHFASLDAPNTEVALCNLQQFNAKLAALTSKQQLTAEDMVKVHELTYTLENAVIRLQKDLDNIAVELEKVHLASESLDQKTIQASGDKYLNATNLIIAPSSCE